MEAKEIDAIDHEANQCRREVRCHSRSR
jgi:hypothetical protein